MLQTRLKLLQEFSQHLRALVPEVRATRVTTLAVLSLGLLWAGQVTLLKVATTIPSPTATDGSTERRFRRWLANRQVPVTALWRPIMRAIVARWAGQALSLAVDYTPHNAVASVLTLGVVVHKRVLPLAWHLVPNQEPWSHRQLPYLHRLFRLVQRWLPTGCTVTLLADSGLTGPDLIRLCQDLGWHFVLRVSTDARQGPSVRLPTGEEGPLWRLVPGPGGSWFGPAQVYKGTGWLALQVSIVWRRGDDQPWVLVSDEPAGWARVRAYRRRVQTEATFADCKRRGWDLEHSKITNRRRLHRLLLAVFLALWWAHDLGRHAIRRGVRRWFDRADRRDLSLVRLGRRWLLYLVDHGRLPPLLIRSIPPPRRAACLS
jgi:hypothetical protein